MRGIHAFSNSNSLKVNIIAQLEFALTYLEMLVG